MRSTPLTMTGDMVSRRYWAATSLATLFSLGLAFLPLWLAALTASAVKRPAGSFWFMVVDLL